VRCLFAILRKSGVWLLLLFLAWVWFFRWELAPPPAFVVSTGAVHQADQWALRPSGTWSSLRSLSDDGGQATVAIYHGDFRFPECRLEMWDMRTGARLTPALWKDREWQRLLSAPEWRKTGLMDCLSQPTGMHLLTDEPAWAALRRRLLTGRARALDDLRKTMRPVQDTEAPDLFPEACSFSPDGHRFAYVARHSLGDGTAVEDVRTGTRLAFLPGLTDLLHIAPGGRTAVSVRSSADQEGEQPRLFLWDLDTSACRAGLLLPNVTMPLRVKYSADGRYVFAQFYTWPDLTGGLRWWDAATGRQVSAVANPGDTTFIEGGRVLVTHPWLTRQAAACEGYVLGFWDLATGAPLGEWDLGAPADGGGMIDSLASSENGCCLAASYDPDYGRTRGAVRAVTDRLATALGGGPARETERILLLDVTRRRELARLPGLSAAFSRDGQWLATLDVAGVVRVWQLPLRRAWAEILTYAGLAALVCWTGLVLLRRLGSGWGSARCFSATPRAGGS
jgi:hypothetical protein